MLSRMQKIIWRKLQENTIEDLDFEKESKEEKEKKMEQTLIVSSRKKYRRKGKVKKRTQQMDKKTTMELDWLCKKM